MEEKKCVKKKKINKCENQPNKDYTRMGEQKNNNKVKNKRNNMEHHKLSPKKKFTVVFYIFYVIYFVWQTFCSHIHIFNVKRECFQRTFRYISYIFAKDIRLKCQISKTHSTYNEWRCIIESTIKISNN